MNVGGEKEKRKSKAPEEGRLGSEFFFPFVYLLGGTGKPEDPLLFFFILFLFFNLSELGLNCSMWPLVSWPGMEPWPTALGTRSLNHWTTREVPEDHIYVSPPGLRTRLRRVEMIWSQMRHIRHKWKLNYFMKVTCSCFCSSKTLANEAHFVTDKVFNNFIFEK